VIPPGPPRPTLTRARKAAFAALTTAMALTLVESTARAYSALRYRNTQALTYGTRFVKAVLSGEGLDPLGAEAISAHGDSSTERVFETRASREHALAIRPPIDVMLDGHPAHFNNLGLRGRDVDLADSHRRRIAIFGGSDTFGAFLEDRETWPSILDSRLQAAGFVVDVLNAGVSGHYIDAVLRTVIALTHTVNVNYVVVTSAYNNRHLLPMQRRYTFARRADWYLYNLSMAHVMVKEKLALLQRQPIDYGLYRQRVHLDSAAVASWIAMYKRRLDQIASVSREQHATLVLCTQGELFQDARLNALSTLDEAAVNEIGQRINQREDIWLSELEYFMQGVQNLAVKHFAEASRDVLFFDGAAVLQDDKMAYLLDPIHPGPLGAAKLAEALAAFFTPLLPVSVE
jgi:lysophospholipase L1-like esterase